MIIKAKTFPKPIFRAGASLISWLVKRRFNKMIISPVEIESNHSYLLMCNHFSFWDGFLAAYLSKAAIGNQQDVKGIYVMVLKKQMQLNPFLKYFGCFSITPGKASVNESLAYAAEKLSTPGNIVIVYPQGNLESCHVRKIDMKDGINTIVPQIRGNCQLIWSSNLLEYFESLKPSINFHLLDCGTNHDFDFENLTDRINQHHQQAIQKQIRFTVEE